MNKIKSSNKFVQLIIFGATGDLAFIKLFPAIYDLFVKNLLPENFQLIGFGRSFLNDKAFLSIVKDSLKKKSVYNEQKFLSFAKNIFYFQGDYNNKEAFTELKKTLKKLSNHKKTEKIFYYSVPPQVFDNLTDNLGEVFVTERKNIKLVLEKPFGTDLLSAEKLFFKIQNLFDTENVFLMDHFLGKEPIRNILDLRLENSIINLLIKGGEISNIQITAYEKNGVGQRVGYFEEVGIMKDMIQSHLLQILAFITMDIPLDPSTESISREKNNILSAIRFSGNKNDAVFAQYKGYRNSEGVHKKSMTDTFCAIKLHIDRRDWFNVPVFIRTGKSMNKELTQVVIEFDKMPFQSPAIPSNKLIFISKPNENVEIFLVKAVNGCDEYISRDVDPIHFVQPVLCKKNKCMGDYENLISDIINCRKKYFLTFEEIRAAWKIIDKVSITQRKSKLFFYEIGSSLKKECNSLLTENNLNWYETNI